MTTNSMNLPKMPESLSLEILNLKNNSKNTQRMIVLLSEQIEERGKTVEHLAKGFQTLTERHNSLCQCYEKDKEIMAKYMTAVNNDITWINEELAKLMPKVDKKKKKV